KNAGKSEVTQRRVGGRLQYDYFLSKKMYVFANAGAEYDFKAGIDLRTFIGGGAGYQFYDTETFKLTGEAGLNYFSEDYSVGDSKSYVAARVAENLGWQINKDVKFEHSVEAFPSLEDMNDFFGKMDNRVKVSLTEKMFAQLQWVMNYDNTPAA